MAKRLVRYKRESGALVKMAETPVLEGGKVDIGWLPVVGAEGSAIISEGENANGRWVKWADGTMVCRTGEQLLGSNPGVIRTVTFPAAFSQTPRVLPTIDMYEENTNSTLASCFIYCAKMNTITTTSCTISVVSIGVPLSNGNTQIFVVGCWK